MKNTHLMLLGLILMVAGILIPVLATTFDSSVSKIVLRFDMLFTLARVVSVIMLFILLIQICRKKKA